jgi:hypothetical protein
MVPEPLVLVLGQYPPFPFGFICNILLTRSALSVSLQQGFLVEFSELRQSTHMLGMTVTFVPGFETAPMLMPAIVWEQ